MSKVACLLGLIVGLVGLLVPSAFALFPFVNDFEAYDQGDWKGTEYRKIMVEDNDTVSIFFFQDIPHSQHNQNFQVLFRRFDKLGNPIFLPRFVTDSSQYQIRGNAHVGKNGRGKWVLCGPVLLNCANWPHCDYDLRAWVSNESGDQKAIEFSVGNELPLKYLNSNPSSAMDSSGNFTITWWRSEPFDTLNGIWCRMYHADASPATGNFMVSDSVFGNGSHMYSARAPRISMTSSGNFVIVWQGDCIGPDCGSGWNPVVYAKVFDRNGQPQGLQIVVSDFREDWPVPCYYPDVAIANDGRFAVAWTRLIEPCTAENRILICLKRYFADGTPMGPEIFVDSIRCSVDNTPTVSLSSDSLFNLLLVWESNDAPGQYTHLANMFAQRFDSKGESIGTQYRINDRANKIPMHLSHAAMNNNGLCGFYWGEWDYSTNHAYDYMQLMDVSQVGFYIPGDADNNTIITISDAVYLIGFIFSGGQAPAVNCISDTNGDGMTNISDVVVLINYIFGGGTISGTC